MAVITIDTELEGLKRKVLFQWLGEPDNHHRILQGAFDDVQRGGKTEWTCTMNLFPKKRVMKYRFVAVDDEHGGRRVLCETEGKRTKGKLHYSLRTPRASSNTLVTLHMDYDPGSVFGRVVDVGGLREAIEGALDKVLKNLKEQVYADMKAGLI